MTHVAELGLAPIRLAIESRLRVRGALMRVILTFLDVKVGSIAIAQTTLRLEALV